MNGEPSAANGEGAVPATFAAALIAYQDARIDGLCHEGAWECALEVLRLHEGEGTAGSEQRLLALLFDE